MRNWRELTEDELAELARLYPTTFNRELAKMFDISIDCIVKNLSKRYGWKKDKRGAQWNCKKKELNEKQLDWFIKHFKHTRNVDIQEKFDIGEGTLHRLARKHGLKKSKQFLRKTQENAKARAVEVVKEYNLMPKGKRPENLKPYMRTGISNVKYFGRKKWKDIKRRAEATRRETVRMERIRIKWGLPQKTKLVLKEGSRKAAIHRFLFKQKGYITYRGDPHIYYDENTQRSERMESNAWDFGLVILPYEGQ